MPGQSALKPMENPRRQRLSGAGIDLPLREYRSLIMIFCKCKVCIYRIKRYDWSPVAPGDERRAMVLRITRILLTTVKAGPLPTCSMTWSRWMRSSSPSMTLDVEVVGHAGTRVGQQVSFNETLSAKGARALEREGRECEDGVALRNPTDPRNLCGQRNRFITTACKSSGRSRRARFSWQFLARCWTRTGQPRTLANCESRATSAC